MKLKYIKNISIYILIICALIAAFIIPKINVSAAGKKKVLVAYFSVTGNTKSVAKKVQKATGGTLYRIKPKKAYTSEDIDYDTDNCRANMEQRDDSARPEIKGKVKNIKKYDVIFIGYPIWWGKEPKVVKTFLESYNLKGKKIVPFCTSGSSGISGSMNGIKESVKGAKVVSGKDLTDESYKSIKKWAKKKLK